MLRPEWCLLPNDGTLRGPIQINGRLDGRAWGEAQEGGRSQNPSTHATDQKVRASLGCYRCQVGAECGPALSGGKETAARVWIRNRVAHGWLHPRIAFRTVAVANHWRGFCGVQSKRAGDVVLGLRRHIAVHVWIVGCSAEFSCWAML